MDKLAIPLVILIALIGVFLFLAQPKRSVTSPETMKPKTSADIKAAKIKGEEAIEKGEYAEAIRVLEPFSSSDDPEIHGMLGYAYSGVQNFNLSAQAFEKAIKKNRNPPMVYALAYVYQTMGEEGKALPLFQELSQGNLPPPVLGKVFLGLARAANWTGNSKSALDAYKKAIKLDPKQVDAFVGFFKVSRNVGKTADFDSIVQLGDQHHGEKFDYNFWKGFFLQEINEDSKALEAFKKCVSLNPENSSSYYYLYKILRKSKKIEEALKALGEFYSLTPALPYVFFQAALDAKNENRLDLAFKFLRGSVLYDRTLLSRDDEGAFAAVQKYIDQKGTAEEKKFMKVFMDYVNGDIKTARSQASSMENQLKDSKLAADLQRIVFECDQILRKEAEYRDYQAALKAQKLAAIRQLGQTVKTPSNVIEKETPLDVIKRQAMANPKDPRLQYSAAIRFAEAGDMEGAKQFLRETLRANPNVSEAYYSMAKIALLEKNNAEAEENLEKALKIRSENSQARSLLASLKLQNGDVEKAIEEARGALSCNPANSEARFVLAEAFMKQAKADKALEQINYALEIEVDPERIQKLKDMQKQLRK